MSPNEVYRTETYIFGFNEFKTTPLGLRAFDGHETDVREALAAGIDWEKEYDCPLEGIVMSHNTELALELIAAGSPVTTAVLTTAIFTNNTALVGHILKHEIIGLSDEFMQSYFASIMVDLHIYQEKIHVLLLAFFLSHGVDPNLRITGHGDEYEHWPALNVVAHRKRIALISLLVDAGANVNGLTPAGESPLYCCAKSRDYKGQLSSRAVCLSYLQSHGATFIPTLTLSQKIQMYFKKNIYKLEPPRRVF